MGEGKIMRTANNQDEIVSVMIGRQIAQGSLVNRVGDIATVDIGGRHVSGFCITQRAGLLAA